MTHEQLRKLAVQWLTNRKKCSVVLSEMVTAAWEIPDAIGWKYGHSVLVECKASRSDFLAQKNKKTLAGNEGMGNERYFLCVPEIIRPEDLSETDYGLLYACNRPGGIRLVKEPLPREGNYRREISMLVSALRRIKTREFISIVPCTDDSLSPSIPEVA